MPKWQDPRGSKSPTAQARPSGGIVLKPTPHLPVWAPDPAFTFGRIGLALHDRGWAVIPQTDGRDGEDRKPGFHRMYVGTPHHGQIRYKNQYRMHEAMPDRQVVEMWAKGDGWRKNEKLKDLNVAGVTGDSPGTHGWFCLDLDILDRDLMRQVQEAADRRFGRTPLMRGRLSTPKAALFFKRKLGALRLKRKNFELLQPFGTEKQQIELKDDGTLITLYGRHHAQGEVYSWLREAEPFTMSPDQLPEADEEQIIQFIGDVHDLAGIVKYDSIRRDYGKALVQWFDTDVGEIRTPPMPKAISEAPVLTDTRRHWLLVRSKPWARYNAGIVAPIVGDSRAVDYAGVNAIAKALFDESVDYLDYTANDKLPPSTAMRVIREMIRGDATKIAAGAPDFAPIGTRRLNAESKKPEPKVRQGVVQYDDELSWLPPPKNRKRLPDDIYRRTDPDAAVAKTLALKPNDVETTARVSREIKAAIMQWLDAVWMFQNSSGDNLPPAHLLKAPTGSGKTTMTAKCLCEWKALHPDRKLKPILMLLPSYTNIDEIAGREDLGLWTKATEHRAADIIAEAGSGLHVAFFKGKLAAGCNQKEKVELLQAAGMPTSRLCKSDVMEEFEQDGEKVTTKVPRYCPFHPNNPELEDKDLACGAMKQLLELPVADLILSPHAFVTSNIPKALKDVVGAVVIDEKIWDKTFGVRKFPLRTFTAGRPEPEATKAEKKKGVDAKARFGSREFLGPIIAKAIEERTDIARAIVAVDHGKDRLDDVRWVTGALQRIVVEIHPDIPVTDLRAHVGKQKTKYLVDEHIAIGLLQERVNAISENVEVHGERDARIKLIDDGVNVCVSWRKKLNFGGCPVMWLDASGNAQILERIWGCEITIHDIDAPLLVKTVMIPDGSYAKSRLLPHRDDSSETVMAKAARQTLLREAISTLSIMHGDSAVVSGSAMSVRKHIFAGWQQPTNVHGMHFGAVRGLDFAKHHAAAFSIGQLEMPPADVDAYTGALTFDLPEPEKPIDYWGNGREGLEEDAPKLQRTMVDREYRLRDGGIATVPVYEPDGAWAKLLVEQVREEELSQFLGRLRPVYRSGTIPVWYHAGRALPKNVVIDEVIGLEDLARPFGRSIPVLHEMAIGGFLGGGRLGHFHTSGVSDAALAATEERFRNSERLQRGVDVIEFSVDGQKHVGFVPAWSGDAAVKVSEVFHEPTDVRVTRQARVRTFGLPRADKVDDEIGDAAKRTGEFDEAMGMITTRVLKGMFTYDDKRSGIVWQGRAQAPHFVVAVEQMQKAVADLNTPDDPLAGVDEDHLILDGMTAEMIAPMLESYDDTVVEAILVAAKVAEPIADAVRKARTPKPAPAEVTFGKTVAVPTPANSADPVPELPPNVVRFNRPLFGIRGSVRIFVCGRA
ncbi:MAG: bifunctional DNA primase/polymerase [Devosia sp.]|uniref:bifunctional DNA primase/polymerase n=1 Tax=Devosia sp. TaxID=1871048 RepID=UPI0024C69216|nr:bifunctional DNA primase/polymerase [Devosia sp.]UYO00194.1 MAG: bifunctional DNA primase/polymerase [Devosia sp.]